MKKLLPLHAMAENFGLVSKSMRPKPGCKSYFTPEGKVALMFLKMYTGLSCPKLTEILYIFFGIHTANVVQLADRIEQRAQLAASWNENMHMETCFQGELCLYQREWTKNPAETTGMRYKNKKLMD